MADAQANVHRLLQEDRVDLFFGPYSSVLTLAVAPIAETHGKILWNHGGSSDEIFARGWRTLIGGTAPASTYFARLPALLRRMDPSIDRLAILHADRGTFGSQVVRGLVGAANREGLLQVSAVACDLASIDPSELLAGESGESGCVIVLVGTFHDEVRLILKREAFPRTTQRFAAVAAGLTAFGEAVGPRAEGLLGPSQWEPGLGIDPEVGPGEAWVLASFSRAFGLRPEYPAVQAFAMGIIAAECVRRAGSLRPEALWEAAAALDVTTCFGRFRIDGETGRQIGYRPVLVEWCNGRKTVTDP